MYQEKEFIRLLNKTVYFVVFVFFLLSILTAMISYYVYDPSLSVFQPKKQMAEVVPEEDPDKIENGIHTRTGLIDAEGLMTVVNNCTACHSSKLITQNRMNEERWNETIIWMQETQNLWDLGSNQEVIVNYLVTNYPPVKKGRRENLKDIDWYVLEN